MTSTRTVGSTILNRWFYKEADGFSFPAIVFIIQGLP